MPLKRTQIIYSCPISCMPTMLDHSPPAPPSPFPQASPAHTHLPDFFVVVVLLLVPVEMPTRILLTLFLCNSSSTDFRVQWPSWPEDIISWYFLILWFLHVSVLFCDVLWTYGLGILPDTPFRAEHSVDTYVVSHCRDAFPASVEGSTNLWVKT